MLVSNIFDVQKSWIKNLKEGIHQGKGTLFRNIQITGRWHYSALGSRRGSYVLVCSHDFLTRLPS